jgi:outer membrane protein assembly factor BamB
LVIGFDTEVTDREFMDNLAFDCYDNCNSSMIAYYREYLQGYSSDDNLGSDRADFLKESDVENVTEIVEIEPNVISADGPMDSPWPMKCQNNRHTGLSPYSTADNYGAEKWRFGTDGWVEGGPVIADDGTLYFGSFDCYLYALNSDGTLKWKYKVGDWIWSTPAIAEDGTIYIGTYGDYLYAINPDGTRKWKFCAWGSISSSPAIADDGTIYFGTMTGWDKGDIYAVNPNGTEKWHYRTDYFIVSDPAIADDGTIYIGSGDSYLYAMYPNGTLRWRFKTDDDVKAHPSIADDGTIYISSMGDYLYALHPDGTLKWKYGGGGDEASPAIAEDGTIHIGNERLRAIYPNGTRKWSVDIGPNIDHASPAISADGTIYVGAGTYIIAINPDGTEKWRKRIANKWVDSSPCIGADGTVYIGSSSEGGEHGSCGYLHAFEHQEFNNPPNKPYVGGKIKGAINTEYIFIIVYNGDPDNNPVSYYVDWGDGTNSGWKYDYTSYDTLFYHTYTKIGLYTIRAKAGDDFGGESDWATLTVSMPKNKIINTPFIDFLENHPNLFPMLRHLIGL